MKIIDLGICIDNNDPKGIGRIRVARYSDFVSEKEKAQKYTPYSDDDLFVATPLLPTNINFIPEVDQAVMIINYNVEKENVNMTYIPGPFTTIHNYNDQSFSTQTTDTTYGVAIKHKPNIFDTKGNYRRKRSEGALSKNTDYAIYGKYGSDLLFTENGLQLRGGKLLSKDRANVQDRQNIYSLPIMSSKSSVLTLKKFPYKMELKEEEQKGKTVQIKNLNHLIEYTLVDSSGNVTLSNPHSVKFYVYKLSKPYGDLTKTNNFNENTVVPTDNIKLINLQNDTITATHEVILNTTGHTSVAGEIRDFIYTLHEDNLKKINNIYEDSDLHPFYFRPKQDFITKSGTTSEIEYKKNILSGVRAYNTVGPQSGLIFSISNVIPPSVKTKKITKKTIVDKKSGEQSFSSLKSDKVYILSTDTNNAKNPINYSGKKTSQPKEISFEKLDKYELTQNNYIEDIEPNTYALVRGDNLVKLLQQIILVFEKHQHNVVGPPVLNDEFIEYRDLMKLKDSIVDDLLNKSIRIN